MRISINDDTFNCPICNRRLIKEHGLGSCKHLVFIWGNSSGGFESISRALDKILGDRKIRHIDELEVFITELHDVDVYELQPMGPVSDTAFIGIHV